MRHQRTAFLVLLTLALVPSAHGQSIPCEFDGVERIVAVADVHGAYEPLVSILRTAGIVDERLRWIAGKTHFVQLGDVLDRGPDSRKVLDLYRRLETEAARAGGRLHYLLGNHEAMRITGDYRYLHEGGGEYLAFVTPRSEAVRREWIAKSDPLMAAMIEQLPAGAVEMMLAYGPDGDYGSMLRRLNAVVRINGILFMHGGLSPLTASMPCRTINDRIRRELTVDLRKTRAAGGAGIASLSFGQDGPLWYRGLANGPDSIEPQVAAMLRAQQATRIVVAHTPTCNTKAGGEDCVNAPTRIVVRFGGKVIAIDTGMQTEHVPAGRPSALEIQNGVLTAIYLDQRETIAP